MSLVASRERDEIVVRKTSTNELRSLVQSALATIAGNSLDPSALNVACACTRTGTAQT